jgi:hypothetical protein
MRQPIAALDNCRNTFSPPCDNNHNRGVDTVCIQLFPPFTKHAILGFFIVGLSREKSCRIMQAKLRIPLFFSSILDNPQT